MRRVRVEQEDQSPSHVKRVERQSIPKKPQSNKAAHHSSSLLPNPIPFSPFLLSCQVDQIAARGVRIIEALGAIGAIGAIGTCLPLGSCCLFLLLPLSACPVAVLGAWSMEQHPNCLDGYRVHSDDRLARYSYLPSNRNHPWMTVSSPRFKPPRHDRCDNTTAISSVVNTGMPCLGHAFHLAEQRIHRLTQAFIPFFS